MSGQVLDKGSSTAPSLQGCPASPLPPPSALTVFLHLKAGTAIGLQAV